MRRLGWLILMIVLISCGSTTPTPVGQPLATAEPPAALGQRIRGPGLALTVQDMQRPAVPEGLSATPGSVFVLVNLTLENTTLQELSYSAGDFKLVDDVGAEYGNVSYDGRRGSKAGICAAASASRAWRSSRYGRRYRACCCATSQSWAGQARWW